MPRDDPLFDIMDDGRNRRRNAWVGDPRANHWGAKAMTRTPVIHNLTCESHYFDAVKSGAKTFEVRFNDRQFLAGDILRLTRMNSGCFGHTPEIMRVKVTYILRDDFRGIQPGWCVMAIVPDEEVV